MNRLSFVGRRLLQLIPVVLGVTLIVFFMIHLIPGDPARTLLGQHATPRAVALLHKEWGLDRPLPDQYWLFMDRLFHGNLGESLFYNAPVVTLIGERIPATLLLLAYATILTVVISVPMATLAASKRNSVRDQVVRVVPLVGLGLPAFWVGIVLIYALGLKAHLFPVGGYGSGFGGHVRSLFLPALTIALTMLPVVVRSLRASMLNVLGAEYVTTARSKGVRGVRLLGRHVLRNAVIPTITVLGIQLGFIIGSTLIVEDVFSIPGLGSLMINSIFQRDFPVVQGVTLIFAIMVVVLNILTDVSYALLDPRVSFKR
jgi:peptide/nickel transport system permease protein